LLFKKEKYNVRTAGNRYYVMTVMTNKFRTNENKSKDFAGPAEGFTNFIESASWVAIA
jgi:hypothetical protein